MKSYHLNSILYGCIAFLTVCLLGVLSACNPVLDTAPNSSIETSRYQPVTIDNCGIATTYPQPPSRVVTMNQAATEVMLALGLENRMVGTAYVDDGVLPQYQQTYSQIPVLAEKYPSREVLLGAEPDFVYAAYISAFDDSAAGARTELTDLGIHSYLSRTACEPPVIGEFATLEDVFQEIEEIGKLFAVEDRSQQLISELRSQLQQVRSDLGAINSTKRIFWYDSEDPPYTAACCGIPNYIIEQVGGENIFKDVKTSDAWVHVNWEDVIDRNPEVIVLIDADWTKAEEKQQLLQSNPAYATIEAVQQQQFVTLGFSYSTPGIRNVDGIERLAKALYPERFKE